MKNIPENYELIDFYEITEESDGKYIEPKHYYYYNEDPENTEKPYRCAYYHYNFPMKLEKFIRMDKDERECLMDDGVKYIDDISEDEFEEWFKNNMVEFKTELNFENLTMDVEPGLYRSIRKGN